MRKDRESVKNVKDDRSNLDLVFQCMLNLGIPLSSKIELTEIENKKRKLNIVDNRKKKGGS